MTSGASVDPAAIADVAAALVRYGEAERHAIGQAEAALRRAASEVDTALTARRADLTRAIAALGACQRHAERDCSMLAFEVSRSQERLARAREASEIVHRAEAQFAARKARHGAAVDSLVASARVRLGRNAADIATFLGTSSGGGLGSGSAGAPGGAPASSSAGGVPAAGAGRVLPGFPDGFAMVPLDGITDGDDAVTQRSEFGKGYSPEDLQWAFDAFQDVVLPALAQGKGIDYFRDRDAREGRLGARSYADTYSGFLGQGGDAIKLSPGPNGFHVDNGRHRVAVARAMGLSEIPARIR